jgi:hypothetical protein
VEDAIAEAVEAYDALDKERSELTARVARLERVSSWAHNGFNDEDDWDRFVEFNKKVYAESPAASLLLHDLQVIRNVADKLTRPPFDDSFYKGYDRAILDVRAAANALEGEG